MKTIYDEWTNAQINEEINMRLYPYGGSGLSAWSDSLVIAWQLHRTAPPGTCLFNLEWVNQSPAKVARNIAISWLYWRDRYVVSEENNEPQTDG